MNREIKFRAWHKKLKSLHKVWVVDFQNKKLQMWADTPEETGEQAWDSFEDVELMQYTGLKDRNGKEIYEGDILKYHSNSRLSDPIEFPKDYSWLKARTENSHWQTEVEVIGNIYENPELLQ
jgi:uncharacterized phage protein (TIGR01671 family)